MIMQGLLQSHAVGRSPTPTFPSENFDLPPITPPASTGNLSSAFQSLGHSAISGRMTGEIMSSRQTRSAQRIMQSFGRPNLPSSVGGMPITQHHPNIPASEEVMEEGSIEKLLDEIVERDMPQGVSEPIMFTPQVPQHSNASSTSAMQVTPQQIQSKALQQVMAPKTVASVTSVNRAAMSMHMASSPQPSTSLGMINSPLNTSALNQNPTSPLVPARTPSPNIQVRQKPSIQLQPTSKQSVKLPTTQTQVSSSLALSQSSQNTVRSSSMQSTSPQLSQLPSNQGAMRLNSAPQSVQTSVASRNASNTPVVSGQSKPQAAAPTTNVNTANWKVIHGLGGVKHNVLPITIRPGSQSLQGLQLHNNPAVLQQIMQAVAPSSGNQVKTNQAANITATQGNQKLIYYVMPQKNVVSGAQASQSGQKGSVSSAKQPVKMILINADSPLVSKSKAITTQSVSTSNANRVQLPLGMTTQVLPMKSESGLPVSVTNSLSSPQFSQAKTVTMPMYASGQQLSGVSTSSQPHGTLPTNQQVHNGPPLNTHSNPMTAASTTSLGSGSSLYSTATSQGTPTTSNVVQITFINEATAVARVVAAPTTTVAQGVPTTQLFTNVVPRSSTQISASAVTSTQPSFALEESDDDDDSKPLAQVAQNLKKTSSPTEKKKKKKGAKRKKKGKEAEEPSQ